MEKNHYKVGMNLVEWRVLQILAGTSLLWYRQTLEIHHIKLLINNW